MDRYQYLLLLAACIVVTLPLELVLRANVYRRWRRLLAVLVPVVVLFSLWDVAAIAWGHWRYNPRYVTGWQLPGRLPVEELAFFVVVPLCGLLTFEAVRRLRGGADGVGGYTALTLVAVGAVVAYELLVARTGLLRRGSFWITMAIVWAFQVLVDGWLTKLSAPIVIYRSGAFSGWRVFFDSPLEDFGFGFALVTLTLVLWEQAGRRSARR